MKKILKKIFAIQKRYWLLLPVALLTYLALDIYLYSFITDTDPADAAIVLGTEIWVDQPSPVFRERINHAIALYRNGSVEQIIFTGGYGEGEQFAESEVARAYTINKGVSEEDIFIETESRTTYENLLGAYEIVQEKGLGRVLIVSDPMHMKRAVMIAKDLGMDAYASPTTTSKYQSWKSQLRFLRQELFNYIAYWLGIK